MSCSELNDSDHRMDCAPYYQHPFRYSIDLKEELRKAVEEERYEDAAKLRDGFVPRIVFTQGKGYHISFDKEDTDENGYKNCGMLRYKTPNT